MVLYEAMNNERISAGELYSLDEFDSSEELTLMPLVSGSSLEESEQDEGFPYPFLLFDEDEDDEEDDIDEEDNFDDLEDDFDDDFEDEDFDDDDEDFDDDDEDFYEEEVDYDDFDE